VIWRGFCFVGRAGARAPYRRSQAGPHRDRDRMRGLDRRCWRLAQVGCLALRWSGAWRRPGRVLGPGHRVPVLRALGACAPEIDRGGPDRLWPWVCRAPPCRISVRPCPLLASPLRCHPFGGWLVRGIIFSAAGRAFSSCNWTHPATHSVPVWPLR